MPNNQTKYFIQTWVPVWNLHSGDAPTHEDDFIYSLDDAISEVEHSRFIQSENKYAIMKVDDEGGPEEVPEEDWSLFRHKSLVTLIKVHDEVKEGEK